MLGLEGVELLVELDGFLGSELHSARHNGNLA